MLASRWRCRASPRVQATVRPHWKQRVPCLRIAPRSKPTPTTTPVLQPRRRQPPHWLISQEERPVVTTPARPPRRRPPPGVMIIAPVVAAWDATIAARLPPHRLSVYHCQQPPWLVSRTIIMVAGARAAIMPARRHRRLAARRLPQPCYPRRQTSITRARAPVASVGVRHRRPAQVRRRK